MSVTEFELQYTELAQYARGIVLTERDRVKRFVQRLVEPYFTALVAQTGQFRNVSQAADCARVIEARKGHERSKGAKGKQTSSGSYQGSHRKKQRSNEGGSSFPALMGTSSQSTHSHMNTSSAGSRPPSQGRQITSSGG